MKATLLRYVLALTTALLISATAVAADIKAQKEPLFIQVFIHDDVSHAVEDINKDYFSWLIKDTESFTGRKVYLKFTQDEPSLTDFPYQGDDLDSILWEWKTVVNGYIEQHHLPRSALRKYLLLTNGKINPGTLGIADSHKKVTAIASLSSYLAPAHELGHLLGGTHEASEILYRPWPCETNLDPNRTVGLAVCYLYSDGNKRLIADYLNEFP